MRVTITLLTVLLLIPAAVPAQPYVMQGTERYFRVDASPGQGSRGPVVNGYVYNTYGHTADKVWLTVEALDGSGSVVGVSRSPLLGNIPNGGRTYFEVPAPSGGTTYRTRVTFFEWVGRGA